MRSQAALEAHLARLAGMPVLKRTTPRTVICWFDQNYYLPDDILIKVDRMSMAHSLEVRPPFLDHRIVEFAATLPREFQDPRLAPESAAEGTDAGQAAGVDPARKKIGFDIPAHEWLRGPLRALLLDTLASGAAGITSFFRPQRDQTLISQLHLERRANLGYHLWGLMILFLWMKTMANPNDAGSRACEPALRRPASLPLSNRPALSRRAIYLGCIVSPPSLMDDVDAVQAQIARNMLTSGDWVTARLDGVAYLEKAPLIYW